jgi:hypothetical protein
LSASEFAANAPSTVALFNVFEVYQRSADRCTVIGTTARGRGLALVTLRSALSTAAEYARSWRSGPRQRSYFFAEETRCSNPPTILPPQGGSEGPDLHQPRSTASRTRLTSTPPCVQDTRDHLSGWDAIVKTANESLLGMAAPMEPLTRRPGRGLAEAGAVAPARPRCRRKVTPALDLEPSVRWHCSRNMAPVAAMVAARPGLIQPPEATSAAVVGRLYTVTPRT